MRLLDTGTLLPRIIPEKILDFTHGDPVSTTMAGLEERNHTIRATGVNIGEMPNIGDRKDWYTDAVFAQQHLTGPNSVTIEKASDRWLTEFKYAAAEQLNSQMLALLDTLPVTDGGGYYIQDYSYFRDAIKSASHAPMISVDKMRFGCASVCLFHLGSSGKLHPLAIAIDYTVNMGSSVVIFNKRSSPADVSHSEDSDWAWRYAKLCVQVSDASFSF